MAQGKFKAKGKLPDGVKNKKLKGKAVTKRNNAPVPRKMLERNKIKSNVSKLVNKAAEEQLRALAKDTPQLSAAQKKVAAAPAAPVPSSK